MLIHLPGPISAEDMAVTGAGARLHSQDTSSLALLYEYEELEGELDFLTRVVALTFYPVVSGTTPLTLGEVQRNFLKYVNDSSFCYCLLVAAYGVSLLLSYM